MHLTQEGPSRSLCCSRADDMNVSKSTGKLTFPQMSRNPALFGYKSLLSVSDQRLSVLDRPDLPVLTGKQHEVSKGIRGAESDRKVPVDRPDLHHG